MPMNTPWCSLVAAAHRRPHLRRNTHPDAAPSCTIFPTRRSPRVLRLSLTPQPEDTMAREMTVKEGARRPGALARDRLLAGIPAKERRLDLAGVSSAVLEGGRGEPVILLHGPGEHALKWSRVIPGLVETHHVIAPDLPGHGASEVTGGPLTRDGVLAWLDALIDRTCVSPPALVGQV